MTPAKRDQTILDLEVEVGRLVRRIRRVIAERARVIHPDLSPAGYLLVAHMVERDSVRASEVVDVLHLDKGAVSRLVQTLVELGLAAKERDLEDGRAWVVTPTDEARERMRALTTSRRQTLGRRLEGWADDELEQFVATLSRYNTSIDGN